MRFLSFGLMLALVGVMSCQRSDKFLEKPYSFNKTRFSKSYLFDTSSAESFAVDVDILWVIDNSGSMDAYQQAVINNSAAFISQFTASSRLHWKMGLISTDRKESPYMGFATPVDWQTSNAVQVFNQAVGRLGTMGDGLAEATFQPTVNVLSAYPKWLRPNAYFIVIAVSDELEQSTMDTNTFLNSIQRKLGGDLSKFIVYGVYGPDSNDMWNRKYEEVVNRTGGKIYSLQSPDYGVLLADLGKDLVQKTTVVNPIVLLDQRPIAKTIQVYYKGRFLIPTKEWTYNPEYNFIEIQDPKILDSANLKVDISFEIDSNYKP